METAFPNTSNVKRMCWPRGHFRNSTEVTWWNTPVKNLIRNPTLKCNGLKCKPHFFVWHGSAGLNKPRWTNTSRKSNQNLKPESQHCINVYQPYLHTKRNGCPIMTQLSPVTQCNLIHNISHGYATTSHPLETLVAEIKCTTRRWR
jgi:hypothetical protein